MNSSEIIVPVELQVHTGEEPTKLELDRFESDVEDAQALSYKLRSAYQSERDKLEMTEVELNRSRIFMVDKNGNMRIVPLMSEH
ncbi:hypothetical protein L4D20_05150 [Vibrio kyushuensis]|uniref:hypothetical protein n=1 Tax=Vibrio kyushuensis TaxID=2910249 RepID=UPI003D0C626C